MSFTDGANLPTEYAYDENGNLTQDLNKKIVDIQYNSLEVLTSDGYVAFATNNAEDVITVIWQ